MSRDIGIDFPLNRVERTLYTVNWAQPQRLKTAKANSKFNFFAVYGLILKFAHVQLLLLLLVGKCHARSVGVLRLLPLGHHTEDHSSPLCFLQVH